MPECILKQLPYDWIHLASLARIGNYLAASFSRS